MPAIAKIAPDEPARAPEDNDAAILLDVARWHELRGQVHPIIKARKKLHDRLPPDLQNIRLDPRGWREGTVGWNLSDEYTARLARYEPIYVAGGLAELDDQIDALFDQIGPIESKLPGARPAGLKATLEIIGLQLANAYFDEIEAHGCDDFNVTLYASGLRMLREVKFLTADRPMGGNA